MKTQIHTGRSARRRGVAAVEMALILPVFLLVMFGTLNASQMMYFRKSLVVAADDGIRLASQRAATTADVQTRIDAILTSRRINNASVTFNPSSIDGTKPGDVIQIQIDANFSGFGFGPLGQGASIPVSVTSAILRE